MIQVGLGRIRVSATGVSSIAFRAVRRHNPCPIATDRAAAGAGGPMTMASGRPLIVRPGAPSNPSLPHLSRTMEQGGRYAPGPTLVDLRGGDGPRMGRLVVAGTAASAAGGREAARRRGRSLTGIRRPCRGRAPCAGSGSRTRSWTAGAGPESDRRSGPAPALPSGLAQGASPPAPGDAPGFEGLPSVDDQLERVSTSVAVNPDVAADIRRGERAQQEGRLADAERHFLAGMQRPGAGAVEARKKLAEVYWLEGRFDEVRELAEAIWREAERAGEHHEARAMLQFHRAMGLNPLPIDRMQAALDRAVERAPQDDRVWLGRGYLALRQGRLTEAQSWLDACRRRRPDDPAVWRAPGSNGRSPPTASPRPARRSRISPPTRIRPRESRSCGPGSPPVGAMPTPSARPSSRRSPRIPATSPPSNDSPSWRRAEVTPRTGRGSVAARPSSTRNSIVIAPGSARMMRPGPRRRWPGWRSTLGRRFEALGLWTLVREQAPGDPDALAAVERLAATRPVRPRSGRTLAHVLAAEMSAATEVNAPRTQTPATAPRRVVPLFRDDAAAAGLRFTFDNGETPVDSSPRRRAAASACSTTTATAGSTSTSSRAARSRPDDRATARAATACSATGATGRSRTSTRALGPRRDRPAATATAWPSATTTTTATPTCSSPAWRSYAPLSQPGRRDVRGRDRDAPGWAATATGRRRRPSPTSTATATSTSTSATTSPGTPRTPTLCRDPRRRASVRLLRPRCASPRCPDHLFRNDGGRFVDVTAEAGIVDRDGRGLGVVAADLDDDGRVDLFVANDMTANFLFRNLGGLRFEEVGHVVGRGGQRRRRLPGGHGRGLRRPRRRRPARPGRHQLLRRVDDVLPEPRRRRCSPTATAAVGLAAPSRYLLGFGIAFLDANNDGRLDLLTANGHVARPPARASPIAMPAQLLLGGADGRLTDVTPPGRRAVVQCPGLGRGLAVGDLDNDGRVDAIVVAHEAPLAYFHNTDPGGHSLTLRLEGTTSNRDAVGARVTVAAGGRRQVAERFGGGSYQSASDPRLHFGLGTAARADAIEVRWPSGRVDRFRGLAADAVYLIREGEPAPRALGGRANRGGVVGGSPPVPATSRRGS